MFLGGSNKEVAEVVELYIPMHRERREWGEEKRREEKKWKLRTREASPTDTLPRGPWG